MGRCFLDQLIDAGVDVLAVALVDRAFAEGDAPVVVRNDLEEIRGIGVWLAIVAQTLFSYYDNGYG